MVSATSAAALLRSGPEWLAQVKEEILDPDRPICDSHHHLFDRPDNRYLLGELLADTGSGHNVVSTVFIECSEMWRMEGPEAERPIGETEFVQGIAAMSASGRYGNTRVASGIVGYVDLRLGDGVLPVLERQVAASPNRFCGIRHGVAWDESPEIRNHRTNPIRGQLLDKQFRRGFSHLGRFGLSFDAWLYHPQLPDLIDLARAFPDQPIVLDHFGGPIGVGPYAGQQDSVFKDWCRRIDELAQFPNVFAKLGGLNRTMNGFGWEHGERPPTSTQLAEATRHYYLHTIERFGPERCMFESNFPVDKVSCSYAVLWNAFKRIVADFSEEEKNAMFRETAERFYRIAR